MGTTEFLYASADTVGWETPEGRLLVAVAATGDPNVCAVFIDGVGPCGRPPGHLGHHEHIQGCCRRAASGCVCESVDRDAVTASRFS